MVSQFTTIISLDKKKIIRSLRKTNDGKQRKLTVSATTYSLTRQ